MCQSAGLCQLPGKGPLPGWHWAGWAGSRFGGGVPLPRTEAGPHDRVLGVHRGIIIGSLPLFPISPPGGLSLWSDAVSSSAPAMSMQRRSSTPRSYPPEVGNGCAGWRGPGAGAGARPEESGSARGSRGAQMERGQWDVNGARGRVGPGGRRTRTPSHLELHCRSGLEARGAPASPPQGWTGRGVRPGG